MALEIFLVVKAHCFRGIVLIYFDHLYCCLNKPNITKRYYSYCGVLVLAASMRLCMGSRRGFICRMKVGNLSPDSMATGHLNRLKQRNSLGPSRDTHNYAVVHCTGYIKNWPPTGQFDNHALSGTCQTLIFAFGDSFKKGLHKQAESDILDKE